MSEFSPESDDGLPPYLSNNTLDTFVTLFDPTLLLQMLFDQKEDIPGAVPMLGGERCYVASNKAHISLFQKLLIIGLNIFFLTNAANTAKAQCRNTTYGSSPVVVDIGTSCGITLHIEDLVGPLQPTVPFIYPVMGY